jgi:hypothetical protein
MLLESQAIHRLMWLGGKDVSSPVFPRWISSVTFLGIESSWHISYDRNISCAVGHDFNMHDKVQREPHSSFILMGTFGKRNLLQNQFRDNMKLGMMKD